MSGSRSKNSNHINRSGTLGRVIQSHGLGELRPCGTVYKSITMPSIQIACSRRDRSPGRFHSCLCTEMLDDGIIPFCAALVPKNDVMSRHGSIGTLLFEVITFLRSFSESSFGEMDMVDVGTFRLCVCRIDSGDGNEQKQHKRQRAHLSHS